MRACARAAGSALAAGRMRQATTIRLCRRRGRARRRRVSLGQEHQRRDLQPVAGRCARTPWPCSAARGSSRRRASAPTAHPPTATPMSVATSGPWRDTINLRFACDAPVATSILGDAQAAVLQCRRRIGGWPQVALVAAVDGRLYEADGILPTLAVIERSIGVLSGRVSATSVVAAAIGRRHAARVATGGARIQCRRCRRIPATDGAWRARQSRRELRRRRDRVSCRARPAAEGARPRQPRHRHRADAPGAAGVRSGPLRRGRHVVQAGGRAGAARQRQGGGRASRGTTRRCTH